MKDRDDKDDAVQHPSQDRPAEALPDLGHNSAIGKRLKAYYDDVAAEPVPDRFLLLLDKLDAAETEPNSRGGA